MKRERQDSSDAEVAGGATAAAAACAENGAVVASHPAGEAEAGVTHDGDALSLGSVAVRPTGSVSKGLGVFAVQPLAENTWVGEYVGEVLTQSAYLARYPNEDAQYVLGANEDYNIDAANPKLSSFTRYLNHASGAAANLILDITKVRKQRAKQVRFYTARDVLPGEELCFDCMRAPSTEPCALDRRACAQTAARCARLSRWRRRTNVLARPWLATGLTHFWF
jgi:hypothetical protein